MSDYMFMLENHLTAEQNRVVAEVQRAAAEANVNVFLTGGAVRDMFGGFPIRDLDFTFEGPALKLAKPIAESLGAEILASDPHRKTADLISPEGVTFELSMARTEKYAKTGGKPHVTPAALHEDLLRRDFTINALGLSLNRASRGLLLDPTNGMGDLVAHELRSTGNYVFYDSPVRLLRMIRLRVRLGFSIAERTRASYRNAREGEVEKLITREELLNELRQAAAEPNIGDLLQAWDEDHLLQLVTPGLTAAALNIGTFQKLQKFREALPFGLNFKEDRAALFFALLAENLAPKEKAALVELDTEHATSWQKLASRSAKLEKEIAAPAMHKASKIYALLSHAPGEQVTYLALRSTQRTVQDRIRNYFTKHVPAAQEITDLQVIEAGYTLGTPKFEKAKSEMISKRLDTRPKKPEPEEAEMA
jgi:tRNA nucleotidyltransferase/poly(A) polymerase